MLEFKPPPSDFKLVGQVEPYHMNAKVDFSDEDEPSFDMQYGYTEGYRRASELLAKQIPATSEQDTLIYPLAYMLRHELELRLKVLAKKLRNIKAVPNR